MLIAPYVDPANPVVAQWNGVPGCVDVWVMAGGGGALGAGAAEGVRHEYVGI
jgi:hypothetical protein